MSDDSLKLALDDESSQQQGNAIPWKALVVDDDEEVHRITRLALSDFVYASRPLEFISAYSAAQAREEIHKHPDVALILLDVVMESDDAGLQFARYVRQELANNFVRIILRTGQPGMAPERHVLKVYDINDYRAKTELTQDRLYTVVYTALSSYRDMMALARSRQQLVGVVAELETLSDITSKKFRSSLAAMVEEVQSLAVDMRDNCTPLQEAKIQALSSRTRELFTQVDDLSKFVDSGKYNDIRSSVDTRAVFEEVCRDLSLEILQLEAEIVVGELPVVIASSRQLYQLFFNLLSNALSFSGTEKPYITINATRHMDVWRFVLADNGVGISLEDQGSIFSLYKRANRTGKQANTGIGLNVCRKIVHWHGGDIELVSEPGKGTQVIFTLPVTV